MLYAYLFSYNSKRWCLIFCVNEVVRSSGSRCLGYWVSFSLFRCWAMSKCQTHENLFALLNFIFDGLTWDICSYFHGCRWWVGVHWRTRLCRTIGDCIMSFERGSRNDLFVQTTYTKRTGLINNFVCPPTKFITSNYAFQNASYFIYCELNIVKMAEFLKYSVKGACQRRCMVAWKKVYYTFFPNKTNWILSSNGNVL
jgi:hypothetical protein